MELLQKKNIILSCKPKPKEDVIRDAGYLLWKNGYVKKEYIDGMLEREKSFSTYIGNGLAIPHGVEDAKKYIVKSGIDIFIFPEGTMWDDKKVYVVVGIAAIGDAHLEILANIAEKFMDEDLVKELISNDVDTIHNIFTGKE